MIGIYGGSFNPVHNGHVELVRQLQKKHPFETLYVVPSKIPPHKKQFQIEEKHRLSMVKLALQSIEGVEVSDVELRSNEVSYAMNTIDHFKKRFPNEKIFFIMGTDAFEVLPQWYGFPDVFFKCSYLVVTRKGVDSKKTDAVLKTLPRSTDGNQLKFIELNLPQISSTEVREKVEQGLPISKLVPKSVEEYLKKL